MAKRKAPKGYAAFRGRSKQIDYPVQDDRGNTTPMSVLRAPLTYHAWLKDMDGNENSFTYFFATKIEANKLEAALRKLKIDEKLSEYTFLPQDSNVTATKSDAMFEIREWLQQTGVEEEDEEAYTNFYFHCGQRWTSDWSCMCNDECPTCHAEIEPYMSRDNADGDEVIHAPEVHKQAEQVPFKEAE